MTYRLDRLTPDQLTAEQREMYDNLTGGKRGDRVKSPDGSLIGPFDALLHAPAVGDRSQALGEALRFGTSLDNRLLELAVCCVGAHHRAEFEWYAHSNLALAAGLDQSIVDAVQVEATPATMADDERIVHAFATALVRTHRVPDDVYGEAVGLLGEQGIVELTVLIGYYGLVSSILNTFRPPLPDGVEPVFGAD